METNFRKKGALKSASFMGDLAIKHGKKNTVKALVSDHLGNSKKWS